MLLTMVVYVLRVRLIFLPPIGRRRDRLFYFFSRLVEISCFDEYVPKTLLSNARQ